MKLMPSFFDMLVDAEYSGSFIVTWQKVTAVNYDSYYDPSFEQSTVESIKIRASYAENDDFEFIKSNTQYEAFDGTIIFVPAGYSYNQFQHLGVVDRIIIGSTTYSIERVLDNEFMKQRIVALQLSEMLVT